MKPAWIQSAALMLLGLAVAGCRQDMQNQPKYIPLRESSFWADGRSSRMPVEHAVARGELRADTYLYTAKRNGVLGNELPQGLLKPNYTLKDLLVHGRERYQIYCAPCHSRTGDGRGAVVSRGFTKLPPSYHEDRLKKAPLGHFYDVMTNGFGAMLNYSAQINPEDRWAIAAYIRALQLSQDAKISDVPESERNNIRDLTVVPGMPSTVAPAPLKHETPNEKKGGQR